MKNIFLNEENDWEARGGLLVTTNNLKAIRDSIQSALQTFKGEAGDPEFGVDYFGIIFADVAITYKINEFIRVITSVEGVESVTKSTYTQDKKTGELSFSFSIKSVYGDLEITQGVLGNG